MNTVQTRLITVLLHCDGARPCRQATTARQASRPKRRKANAETDMTLRSVIPRGGMGDSKGTSDGIRVEFSWFELDLRGDRAPQSLAGRRRGGSRHVVAACPRGVAAHRPAM